MSSVIFIKMILIHVFRISGKYFCYFSFHKQLIFSRIWYVSPDTYMLALSRLSVAVSRFIKSHLWYNSQQNYVYSTPWKHLCAAITSRNVCCQRIKGSRGFIGRAINVISPQWCTVYPKKYAHVFCFAVLCCGYTLTDFPISIRLTSLALWQSNDCPSASKATLVNMDKYFMWIHYVRLHNHNKAKHNKTVCIFIGIYCIWLSQSNRVLQNALVQ